MTNPTTTLITGANRGLGLAYARQLLTTGRTVHATVRTSSDRRDLDALLGEHPDRLVAHENDLRDEADVEALVAAVSDRCDALDLLINNAGVLTDHETLATVRLADLMDSYRVNAALPLLLVKGFAPLLRAAPAACVVNISSSFASIALKTSAMPARYSYSASKAAVNMVTKTLAGELEDDGITVVSIHPGWVRTGIGGPDARFSAEEAAAAVVATIDGLDPSGSGTFLTWDGRPLDW